MKNLTTIALLFLTLSAFTQSERNYYWDWDYQKNMYKPIQYTPTKNVDQIEFTVNRKGKLSSYYKKYNASGKMTSLSKKNKNGTVLPLVSFEYNADNKITESKVFTKKGELKSTTSKKYNAFGRLAELKKRDKNGKVILKNTWTFNADSCVIESSRYKNEDNLQKNWKYEYFTKCEKSKSTLYNGKGKVKNVWTYDCKSEGEKLEKKKNQTQICKWDESTKEFLIKVTQTFNEKGEIEKHVSKFTLEDTLIVESTSYDKNDKPSYKSTYNKDYKLPLVHTYYKKCKAQSTNTFEYENGLVVRNTYAWKSGNVYVLEYKYENSLLVELTSKGKKGKLYSTINLKFGKTYSVK